MTSYVSIESWKNYSHPLVIYFSLPLFPHPHFSDALDVCHGLKDVELHVQVLLLTWITFLVLVCVIFPNSEATSRFLGHHPFPFLKIIWRVPLNKIFVVGVPMMCSVFPHGVCQFVSSDTLYKGYMSIISRGVCDGACDGAFWNWSLIWNEPLVWFYPDLFS